MEILSTREQRSPVLVAVFNDGYATGWRFAVPEVFRNSLDIKLTPVTINKQIFDIYTQGKQYNFTQGAILYDTRKAYEMEWGKALQHIKLMVQIEEVIPSDYEISESIETKLSSLGILRRKKEKGELGEPKQETADGLLIKKQVMAFGKLKFKLFRPNKDKSAVEELDSIECDQEEFVAFLQTGIIRTNDAKRRDLFKEYSL